MTPLYHITHIKNLPTILDAKGLWCDQERARQGFDSVGIAHSHIKTRRARRIVPLASKGMLADYVPFYFAPKSPMLYAIHMGKVEGYVGGQESVIYLVSSAEAAVGQNRPWCFTDGHADMEPVEWASDLKLLESLVDWEAMKGDFWNNIPDKPDRKRRRQAEFLVHRSYPWEAVHEIGVYGAIQRLAVENLLLDTQHRPKVSLRTQWYY